MPLASGTRLGPYEILAPLGAGGMGEVYRARDPRLGRDVAIKVLPASLSSSPESRSRFEREARTVSSLNHPHICTLHDVGREGDTDFLVMELIEGETLAQRLAKGPLPTAEVLKYGAQIADALDRAHRAGVIHRDLKPGNVMLTKSGAKLMDFGLARATGMAGPAAGSGVTMATLTQSPTVAAPLTAEGTIVGTFQYMSPEQLEGRESDARSDLWALGCVLYEMATGKRAFEGKSQASLIGAIMHTEPAPASQSAPLSPPALDRLITACLAKDPADRVQNAHDVKLQLAWMAEGVTSVSGTGVPALPPGSPISRRGSGWIAFALVALAAAGATAVVMKSMPRRNATMVGSVQRYTLGSADLTASSAPMLSPDGRFVVSSVRTGATRQLYRRHLNSFEMTVIAGTEDGTAPFFSPDGAWIGFMTTSAIRKVPIDGGAAQTILNEPRVDAADWGKDGLIYFTPRSGGADGRTALARVPATGGRPEVVAVLDSAKGETEAWLPEILPDGKTVLVTMFGGSGSGWQIVAIRPNGSRHPVAENALLSRFTRSGYLFYFDFDSQVVLAAPFDPVKALITGPAVPVTEPVESNNCFDVSDDGNLVYVPTPGAGDGYELVWLDRKGAATPAMETRGPWAQPRISPDGRRVLLRKTGTTCELWMLDIAARTLSRAAQGDDHHDPVWSPDGRRIMYQQARSGEMVTITVEGARVMTRISRGGVPESPQSWSAGGDLLAYTLTGRGTRSDIWVRPMDGSSPPTSFLATEFTEGDPSISPDGRWIAYTSNETGSSEVFIRPYPDTGTTWQVSRAGGANPLWSRDGRELYFTVGSAMMVTPIETRPTLRVGTPTTLFEGGFNVSRSRDFDVDAGGRFVAVHRSGGGELHELRMLLNWPEALKRTSVPSH